MCIAAGCDYLDNIKSIGINKAHQIVNSQDFLLTLEQHKYAPENYRHKFLQAVAVFHHQQIYDIQERCVKPLQPWRREVDQKQFGPLCGEYPLYKMIKNLKAISFHTMP